MKNKFFELHSYFTFDEFGIGVSTGKTRYDKWKFYLAFDLVILNIVFWFWRK